MNGFLVYGFSYHPGSAVGQAEFNDSSDCACAGFLGAACLARLTGTLYFWAKPLQDRLSPIFTKGLATNCR
jgi:hypothetical protein